MTEIIEPIKRCPKCGRDLPHSAFKICMKAHDGLRKRCMECNDRDLDTQAKRAKVNLAELYDPIIRG